MKNYLLTKMKELRKIFDDGHITRFTLEHRQGLYKRVIN